ncbi:MAG TPA: RNA polymerase sigma factor [Gemmatimonadaceae bacterium]|nr:RNA polymerase sigma factor [Gemmatimonadaceae bacterium]
MPQLEFNIPHEGDDFELARLARRARAGSAAAFEALATRVRDRVRRWAVRLTHDRDDAEDVAQLVLVRLHERVGEFEGRSRFTTWLYHITRNIVISRHVTAHRRNDLLAVHSHEMHWNTGQDAPPGGHDAAHIARLARACVSELSRRERRVFELSDLHGLNSTEIARQLHVKPATVRVLLLRARRRIRLRMLAEHPWLLEDYQR